MALECLARFRGQGGAPRAGRLHRPPCILTVRLFLRTTGRTSPLSWPTMCIRMPFYGYDRAGRSRKSSRWVKPHAVSAIDDPLSIPKWVLVRDWSLISDRRAAELVPF